MVPRLFFFFFCLLLLFPVVSALIISPARVDLGNPYEEQEFTTTVYNDLEDQEIVVEVQEKYPLKEGTFEVVGENKVFLGPLESKEVRVLYHPPSFEQFGEVQVGLVRFYQVPYINAQVGATVAVNIPVYVTIPYPEKFLLLEVATPELAVAGDLVPLEAQVTHKGTSVIDRIQGYFLVTGESYEKKLPVDDMTLFLPSQSERVETMLDTSDMESGEYIVTFTAMYDGEVRTSDPVTLLIGAEYIQILSLSPQTLVGGQVNTVTATFFNQWVDDLTGAVTMELQTSGESTVLTHDAGSFTFPSAATKDIVTSLDLASVASGAYQILVRVTYDTSEGEKSQEKVFPVTISGAEAIVAAPEEEKFPLTTVLLIVSASVILLLLILVVVLLVKRQHVSTHTPTIERTYTTGRKHKQKLRPSKGRVSRRKRATRRRHRS